jgi:hypothetical protein
MNGHEQFEGWKWEKKLGLLKRLISIFGAAEDMGKIYVHYGTVNLTKAQSCPMPQTGTFLLANTGIGQLQMSLAG